MASPAPTLPLRLGLRANAGQFALLVGINGLVGGMLGQERTILPLLGKESFGLSGATVALTFLIAFGVTKAATNLLAGHLADRYGRKPVLVTGWLLALPVPLLIIWAPSWAWIVAANVLLGVSQGLTWSTTVLMKVDLVGSHRRGLALGLNEAAGYGAVALTALATGLIAASYGLRPAPFFLGIAFAGLGLGASVLLVRETRGHALAEQRGLGPESRPSWATVFQRTTLRHRSLSAASQAGLVNNLNDGVAWGLLPLYYLAAGLALPEIAVLSAAYPAVWGIGQMGTGALSDRIGRKRLIVGGMVVQGLALMAIGLGS
ncbi:MAG: MFS transporter, partial [Chloroflexi bacterium]|nr:MFS transporter [Chloroflexota bacterium]